MTTANLIDFVPATTSNAGDAREWAVCGWKGVSRSKHDSTAYDRSSDVNVGSEHISVKSSKFTLMSGTLCRGLDSFDAIWNLYAENAHSNRWVYVTADYTAYEMDKNEFQQFVYQFCGLEKDSVKNGGNWKIRCKAESKKMLKYLEAHCL